MARRIAGKKHRGGRRGVLRFFTILQVTFHTGPTSGKIVARLGETHHTINRANRSVSKWQLKLALAKLSPFTMSIVIERVPVGVDQQGEQQKVDAQNCLQVMVKIK